MFKDKVFCRDNKTTFACSKLSNRRAKKLIRRIPGRWITRWFCKNCGQWHVAVKQAEFL